MIGFQCFQIKDKERCRKYLIKVVNVRTTIKIQYALHSQFQVKNISLSVNNVLVNKSTNKKGVT